MGQPLMCNHLRRHKPDSYLVAEQDTLLFFYCFQTARMWWRRRRRAEGGLRGGAGRKVRKERGGNNNNNNNRCSLAVQKNAATVHKMGHYPSTVYHYVVDKSMALTVMTLCYSKHKALRLPPCLIWRLQRGSTWGKGTHSQEGCVQFCVHLCRCVTGSLFIEHIFSVCVQVRW